MTTEMKNSLRDENELNELKQHIHPIQLKYINDKPRRTIGKKKKRSCQRG